MNILKRNSLKYWKKRASSLSLNNIGDKFVLYIAELLFHNYKLILDSVKEYPKAFYLFIVGFSLK